MRFCFLTWRAGIAASLALLALTGCGGGLPKSVANNPVNGSPIAFGIFRRIGIPGTGKSTIVGGVAAGGPAAGQPESLTSLMFNSDNGQGRFVDKFYALDASGNVINNDPANPGEPGTPIFEQDAVASATTVAVAAGGGSVYVVDNSGAGRSIRRFRASPFAEGTALALPASFPATTTGIACTKDGSVIYAFSGTRIQQVIVSGAAGASTDAPANVVSLAVDTAGSVYAGLANRTIVRYSANLGTNQVVVADNTLATPFYVAVNTPDLIYVADSSGAAPNAGVVKVYNSSGALSLTAGAQQLQNPIAIAVDSRGWIFVLDRQTNSQDFSAFTVVMPRT